MKLQKYINKYWMTKYTVIRISRVIRYKRIIISDQSVCNGSALKQNDMY